MIPVPGIHHTHNSQGLRKACLSLSAIILFTSASFIVFLSSCTVHAVDSKAGHEMLTVTGKLRLVGNEPFTHLVITTDDGKDYLIEGALEKELRTLQYQEVTVTGQNLPPVGEFRYRIDVREYSTIESARPE